MRLTGVFLFLLFLQAHFDQDNSFDFQKYIRRALDKDFGVLVGIR
jgi:mlo protein